MKDLFGRTINYLRISVTEQCNLNCMYCMPFQTITAKPEKYLTDSEIFTIVKSAAAVGIDKIRLTGGEPLIRKNLARLIEKIATVQAIKDIALTTNGILLEHQAAALKRAGLKRLNISLDTLNAEKFQRITGRDSFDQVVRGIEAALQNGFYPLKINVVLMKGINDDEIVQFAEYTKNYPIDVRFIELMPIGKEASLTSPYFIPGKTVLEQLPQLINCTHTPHSPAEQYRLPDGKGRVGIIHSVSSHFCCDCNRLRLTADGKLRPCLHHELEFDLKKWMREGKDIEEIFEIAVKNKPECHQLNSSIFAENRGMNQIGG